MKAEELAWLDLPSKIKVRAGDYEWLDLTKGVGSDELMLLILEIARPSQLLIETSRPYGCALFIPLCKESFCHGKV